MFNFRWTSPNQVAAAGSAALVTAALLLSAPLPSFAQDGRPDVPTYDNAPKRSTARRSDSFRPTDTGPGLGTLTTPAPQSGGYTPGPYAAPGYAPPASFPPANRVGATPADDAPPPANNSQGSYAPRYSEPVRPYASGGADQSQRPAYGSAAQGPSYAAGPSSAQYGGAPRDDVYRPPQGSYPQSGPNSPQGGGYQDPPYRQQDNYGQGGQGQGQNQYQGGQGGGQGGQGQYSSNQGSGYGQPYAPPPEPYRGANDDNAGPDDRRGRGFSNNEILGAGHKFFGSMSQGLATVVENSFQRQGRPNGYILGEEGGGAFIAGLRYGEGVLYTRDAGTHKVYWQGPSLGYDIGGAGSKTMILVYNLRSPNEIYERFGGVDGSAYLVGGVGMTVLTRDHITLAPIRTGVGLRLGANVGYLKFTPQATWNPF